MDISGWFWLLYASKYYVESYNLNESDLTVLFKSPNEEIISKDTKIGFAFELVNDEIKRDAVKLNGLFFINMANRAIFAKSEDPKKCSLVSFSHSVGLDKVKERLNNLNAKNNHNKFYIETHSDFTINRFRYCLAKDNSKQEKPSCQIVFFERKGIHTSFTTIPIAQNGRYNHNMPEAYGRFFIYEELKMLDI